MTFVKGRSGNPGGRPKKVREVEEIALQASPECMRILIAIAQNEDEDARARTAAIKEIFDRGLGKAIQRTEITGAEGLPLLTKLVDGPPSENYEQWVERKKREREANSKGFRD